MQHDTLTSSGLATAGVGLAAHERPNWRAHSRFDLYRADVAEYRRKYGFPLGDEIFRAENAPYDAIEHVGNLVTGAGVANIFTAINTGTLATPYSTTNAQLAVGDSSTAAKPGDADLGAAAGSTQNTGDISAATNASPIVLTVPGWTVQPTAGQVVVVAGVVGNTAANGTFEVSASTGTTLTLLNSTGNGVFSTSAGSTVKIINKYRQSCSSVTSDPAVGGGITNVTNSSTSTITTTNAHGLAVNQIVQVASVGGATGANGTWYVASVPTSTTFTVALGGSPGVYTSGGTVNLLGGAQYVASFGTANANFAWAEFGMTTGGAAANKQASPPPTLFNHAVSSILTKTSAASVTFTLTLSIS